MGRVEVGWRVRKIRRRLERVGDDLVGWVKMDR